MNIYQKMAAATAEMETVSKNLEIVAGRNSYKAVSERDVIDAVKKIEAKHGIYSFPVKRSITESDALESETNYNGNVQKKTTFFLRIETVYRFVNVEDPSDYIETVSYGDGLDAGDKATGKAMTYADKYALMKAYKISTGEDPDQAASEDRAYTRKNTSYRAGSVRREALQGRDALLAELRAFCDASGVPEEWVALKYGFVSFVGMPDALLEDVKTKQDKIKEAYGKEGNK